MKKEYKFTIKNPPAVWLSNRRYAKVAKKWNSDLKQMNIWAKETKDGLWKWDQLVWQEIIMWVSMNKQVGQKELDHICEIRGLDENMTDYLREMMKHIGLGKEL